MALLPNNPVDNNWASIGTLIAKAVNLALSVAGGLAIIYLMIGAIQYFTAYGDEAKATTAKNTILYAIIGIVVIVLAKVIIGEVWGFVTNAPLKFL